MSYDPTALVGVAARRADGGVDRTRNVVVAILTVALLATTAIAYVPSAAAAAHANPWSKIRHVVILMMENHSFDNYFGTYCQSTSIHCPNTTDGIPKGTCVPMNDLNVSQGCVAPFNFTQKNLTTVDLNHWAEAALPAWNNGSMNGFYKAEGSTMTPFGTYNGTLIPTYWDMAEEFGLADHMFSSALSYSLPNHWYLVAGNEPGVLKPLAGPLLDKKIPFHHQYLNQSNGTTTVEQELNHHKNVSWTYYDYPLSSYQT
ncbi:MAG: hypothetical protein L3K08_06860, partial [Thermoplasmata archaeon]|nr:hypothetical protein [Thermoplasmata archaeon]